MPTPNTAIPESTTWYERGIAMSGEGRHEEAAAAYRKSIGLGRDTDSQVWIELGGTLAKLARWEEAKKAFETAARLGPESFWAHYGLGDALTQLQQWPASTGAFERASALDPASYWARYQLGHAWAQLDQWEAAAVELRTAVGLDDSHFWAHFWLGTVLSRLKQWEEAATAFQCAASHTPGSFWAHYGLGEALAHLERWPAAVDVFRRASVLDPNSGWARYQLGHALAQLEQWDEAVVELRVAAGLDGTHFWAQYWLGMALSGLERWQQAVDAFDRAVELDPNVGWAHGYRAVALLKLDRADAAADALRRALVIEPDWCRAHYTLGLALARLGQSDAAVAKFNDALDIEHRHWQSYVAIGDTLRDSQRVPEAAEAYRRAADFAPPNECLRLAGVLRDCRRLDDAIATCLRAILSDVRLTEAYRTLTALLVEAGRDDEVPIVLEQADVFGAADDEMRAALVRTRATEKRPASSRTASTGTLPADLIVTRAENDLLFGEDGRSYIDLFCGAGTALLGHVHPEVTAALHRQLDRTWNTGVVPTPARLEAVRLLDACVPPAHGVVAFYSTGMEAVEFALRLARGVTGRRRFIGFNRCMHGKSMATAALGWPNDAVTLPDMVSVPYVPRRSESEILEDLADRLADEAVAAVVIEPLQGSGGGHLASPAFFRDMADLCARRGTLLIVDEIFTGFYRTGAPFLHSSLGVDPDVLLVGKAMGNGFPVSAVVARRQYEVGAGMLPGSTYAANALAMSVVAATLATMQALPMAAMVDRIGRTVSTMLGPLVDSGIQLRGAGALWILEFPDHVRAWDVAMRALRAGVIVSVTGPYIRLLPPATVSPDRLTQACCVILDACAVDRVRDDSGRAGDRLP